MVRTRWDYIQREHSETASTGTIAFDLPEKGSMPNLLLNVGCTPTSTSAPALPVSDMITKLEIVDGGLVIKSLTGNQLKGLSMLHGHNPLASTEINQGAVAGYDNFHIPMGGLYNGTRYAPDMGQFSNPQIRITWDSTITTTEFGATTTTDSAPALLISLLAELTAEAGAYTHGYVKSSIIKEYTQATNTNTFIEIPRGDQLIGIGIEAGYDALDWTEDVQEIKFDFNNGEWIPFHLREKEIMPFQQMIYKKPFQYSWFMDLEDAMELDTHMGYLNHLSIMGCSDVTGDYEPDAFAYDPTHKGVETLTVFETGAPAACTEYKLAMVTAIGWAPFHIWYVPMKVLTGGENDLINTMDFGRLEVEMLSGGSASTSSTPDLIAEFLRT